MRPRYDIDASGAIVRQSDNYLTQREIEALRLLGAGLRSKKACAVMGCSVRTFDHIVCRLLRKLKVSKRRNLIEIANRPNTWRYL